MQTDRLILRPITAEDAGFLYQLMNTPKWHQLIGDRGIHSESNALRYINERMNSDLAIKGFVNHVMWERETDIPVGTCSLHDREGVEGVDIGYALLPAYEGKGYAYEGAEAMVQLAFERHHLTRVSAITNDQNTRSCRVLEKLESVHEGLHSVTRQPGKYQTVRPAAG